MKNTQTKKMTKIFRTGKNSGFKAILENKEEGSFKIYSFFGGNKEFVGICGLGKNNGNLDLSSENISEVLELCGFFSGENKEFVSKIEKFIK